jgi:hypothetical protein
VEANRFLIPGTTSSKKLPDGDPLWVETAASMEAAEKLITELASTETAEYAIFDSRNGFFVKPFTEATDEAVDSQDAA